MNELQKPVNVTEHYLYGINMRLDALIHMFSSFLEVYANQNNIATTNNDVQITTNCDTIEEKPKRTRRTK